MPKRLLIASALLFAGANAHAQEPPAAGEPQLNKRADVVKKLDDGFARIDTDKDGFVGKSEIEAYEASRTAQANEAFQKKLEQEFAKLDKDSNGAISLAEFKGNASLKPAGNADEDLKRLDSNKDGKLSAAEFKARILAAFDRLDSNKDGTVSADEQKKAVGR